jgi:Rrf2 family protein
MRCSRTIAYGIDAVVRIAQEQGNVPVPCSRLAREGGLPHRFLLQVLHTLVSRGVLRSERGVDGGYLLARPPNRISVLQIVEAFENPLETIFPSTEGLSREVRQVVLATLRQASQAARAQLQMLTIADLVNLSTPPVTPTFLKLEG